MVANKLTLRKISLGLYIVFVCYVPLAGTYVPKIFGDVSLAWLSFYLLLLAFVMQLSMKPPFRIFNPWIGILTFYTIIVVSSVLWASYESYDLFTVKRLFARYWAPILVVFIAINLFTDESAVRKYTKHISLAALLLSLIAIYEIIFRESLADDRFRASASFENPNGLAIFLVLTIPCITYAIENRVFSRKIGWTITAAVIGGVISTVSRKGMITMVVVFLMCYLLRRQFRKAAFILVLFTGIAVLFSGYQIISGRFTEEKFQCEFQGKTNMAYLGWKMFKRSPLIGLGYMGYVNNIGKYVKLSGVRGVDAHNMYVTVLTNYGLVGILTFMPIFFYPIVMAIRRLGKENSRHSREMAIICISCVVPFMINGWFAGGLMQHWSVVMLLYTHIVFLLAKDTSAKDEKL